MLGIVWQWAAWREFGRDAFHGDCNYTILPRTIPDAYVVV